MKRRNGILTGMIAMAVLGAVPFPARGQDLLERARQAFAEGNEMRAWQLFSELRETPDVEKLSAPFAIWIAEQYRMQRRFADAMKLCDGVLAREDDLEPETAAAALLVRGDVLRDRGDLAAARLVYQGLSRHKEYRETAPGREAEFRVVDVLRRVRDYNTALDMLERLKDHPDIDRQTEAYYYSALISFDQGFYEEAREYLAEVKRRREDHVEAIFLEAELDLIQDRLHDPDLEIGSRVLTAYLVPGRPLTMRMSDRNLAVVRGGAGIPVEIVTSEGKDFEKVNLLPSPRDATLFRASLNTELAAADPENLRLEVLGSDMVTYKIADAFQAANDLEYPPKRLVVVADAELTVTSGDFLPPDAREDELLRRRAQHARLAGGEEIPAYERMRDTRVVRPGNPVRIEVSDPDQSITPQRDKVYVNAVASSGNRVAGVELTETEPYSGRFRGELPTRVAAPRARASGGAPGAALDAPIDATVAGAWRSDPAAEAPVWYEVDLMSLQTLTNLTLELEEPLPEDSRVSLRLAAEGEPHEVSWPPDFPDVQAYGYVDLAAHFGPLRHTAAYLYTEIESDSAREAVFRIGSCDGVTLWVNGERVHSNPGGRPWKPEQDVVTVPMKPGVNGILMKILQVTGPWGGSLTIQDGAGEAFPGVPESTPARPGVVTRWHVFDRPTPENIEVSERINVRNPVRIGGKVFRWTPVNVRPPVYLARAGKRLNTVFNRPVTVRTARWTFGGAPAAVRVASVVAENTFGDAVLPRRTGEAEEARILELAPGDRIDFTYRDQRRIRQDELVGAVMHSAFYDAEVMLAYETIGRDRDGQRVIVYDRALRYRHGETESLVVRVVDYDCDVTSDEDAVKVLVRNSTGEDLWIDAIETRPHSGEFVAILRLGETLGTETMRTAPGTGLSLHYQDSENTDGRVEKTAAIEEAGDQPPEIVLLQAVVFRDTEGLAGEPRRDIVRIMEPTGRDPEQPVLTSLDTNLFFRAIYPYAALSENSVLTARAIVEGGGDSENASTETVEIPMTLSDPVSGEFEASVVPRIGEPGLGTPEPAETETATTPGGDFGFDFYDRAPPPEIALRPDDLVRIEVPGRNGNVADRFALASDGVLRFTDSRYEEAKRFMHLGDFLHLQVFDRDQDVSSDIDTVRVGIDTGAERKGVELTETMPHSGVFARRFFTEVRSPQPAGKPDSAREPSSGEPPMETIELAYGDTIRATYEDEKLVSGAGPREVEARMRVYPGADAEVAAFTKRFSDESIAVRTRLLTAEALFELAKHHRSTGQEALADEEIAEGKAILEEAISDFPHTEHAPHAEFLLANLAQELEQYDRALTRYNRVLAHWPDSEYAPRSQLRKAICLEKLGDEDNALDAYVELTYMYPSSELVSDAVVRMGQYFYRVERFDVAASVFASFYDNNEANALAPRALFLAAQSYLRAADARRELLEGRYDRQAHEWLTLAIERYEQLLESVDDKDLRAESMYWLADAYMRVRDMKNAYQNFTRLTWDYPETRWARFARGQLVQNASSFEKFKED